MVEIGFYALSFVMASLVYFILLRYGNDGLHLKYMAIVLSWVMYLQVLIYTGVLANFHLPPRVPLIVILVSFFILYIATSGKGFKKMLLSCPDAMLVYIQSFRILVELLIYAAFIKGVFPKGVTFEGTNPDILVGISAVIMGLFVQKNKVGKKAILIWNVVALLMLTLTGYSFVNAFYSSPYMHLSQKLQFVSMPYLLLPGVLLPLAVFFHVSSIRKALIR